MRSRPGRRRQASLGAAAPPFVQPLTDESRPPVPVGGKLRPAPPRVGRPRQLDDVDRQQVLRWRDAGRELTGVRRCGVGHHGQYAMNAAAYEAIAERPAGSGRCSASAR